MNKKHPEHSLKNPRPHTRSEAPIDPNGQLLPKIPSQLTPLLGGNVLSAGGIDFHISGQVTFIWQAVGEKRSSGHNTSPTATAEARATLGDLRYIARRYRFARPGNLDAIKSSPVRQVHRQGRIRQGGGGIEGEHSRSSLVRAFGRFD